MALSHSGPHPVSQVTYHLVGQIYNQLLSQAPLAPDPRLREQPRQVCERAQIDREVRVNIHV